ncbi:MAG: NAD(P)-dependent oxidoreductase [Thermoplasmataceae archaeon]
MDNARGLAALICDPVDSRLIDGLLSSGIRVSYEPAITASELARRVKDYDIIVVRSRTKVNRDIISNGSRLRIIARAGIGTDNIDLESAAEHNIDIVTAAGSSTASVAELNVALAVSLARKIPLLSAKAKNGAWVKETGMELHGKVAGIIGFGRIGQATAWILRSMGMKIIAHDPVKYNEAIENVQGSYVSIEELFMKSDVIFVLASFSRDSAGAIGKSYFDTSKRGVLIVNTSRAQFINGPELLEALMEGQVGGYATDVFWHEPPESNWEKAIAAMDNVIVTPHIGAQTAEAQERVAEYTLKNLLGCLRERVP